MSISPEEYERLLKLYLANELRSPELEDFEVLLLDDDDVYLDVSTSLELQRSLQEIHAGDKDHGNPDTEVIHERVVSPRFGWVAKAGFAMAASLMIATGIWTNLSLNEQAPEVREILLASTRSQEVSPLTVRVSVNERVKLVVEVGPIDQENVIVQVVSPVGGVARGRSVVADYEVAIETVLDQPGSYQVLVLSDDDAAEMLLERKMSVILGD